ncbi:MAG: HDOD domain-containing protein [Myxococcota bacterium]
MALAWLNKWFSGAPEPAAGPTPVMDEALDEATQLRATLSEMPIEPPEWCEGAPPSLDASVTREWLIDEARQIRRWSRGDSTLSMLAAHLVRTLSADDLTLPPLPETAMRLFELLQNEEISINAIVETLSNDPALVQRVWARASSAHFATPPKDLKYAVARVGMDELSRMAASELISARMFKTAVMHRVAERARFRSLLTAELAAANSNLPRNEAFLSGLMHATGALMMLRTVPQESPSVLALLPSILRRFEAPLAMLVLNVWDMPEQVTFAVGMQSNPEKLPPEIREMGRLVRSSSIAAYGAEKYAEGVNIHALEALKHVVPAHVSPVELFLDANRRFERMSTT